MRVGKAVVAVAVAVFGGGFSLAAAQDSVGPAPVSTKPSMRASPPQERWTAVYPAEAARQSLPGVAKLRCNVTKAGDLTECVVVSEEPAEQGFGEAALKLAEETKVNPGTVDGETIDGAQLVLPFKFTPPERAPNQLAAFPTANPAVECRTLVDPPRYYPKAAQRAAVQGAAQVACELNEDRSAKRCTWISEDPAGYGFGPAAAEIGCKFKLRSGPDGAPMGGKTFVAPIKFKLPG